MPKKYAVLQPNSTASWLLQHSKLSYKQIADFCGLNKAHVKMMHKTGKVAKEVDPINMTCQITKKELKRCEDDENASLQFSEDFIKSMKLVLARETKSKSRYTPIARRKDKPNAIAWLVRKHPNISDTQIMNLVGTTKKTVQAIRDKTHWNMQNITPHDPVLLGICKQSQLDEIVSKLASSDAKEKKSD